MIEFAFRVERIGAVLKGLSFQKERAKSFNKSAIVGYKARYSIYVHEINKGYKKGVWKFLTQAELDTREEYISNLRHGLMEVASDKPFPMVELLLGCCSIIMSRSQELVPVDTGYLARSRFQREDEWQVGLTTLPAK